MGFKKGNAMSNRHTRCQALILNENEDKILLVKHLNIYGHVYWWFPGGGLEVLESEEACIKRELLEELSIELSVQDKFVLENILERKYRRYVSFIFTCKLEEKDFKYEDNIQWKIITSEWFNIFEEKNWSGVFADPDILPFMKELKQRLTAKTTVHNSK